METLFRVSTLTVPTAASASAYAANTQEVAAAGDQCLSAFGILAMMVMVLPMQAIWKHAFNPRRDGQRIK